MGACNSNNTQKKDQFKESQFSYEIREYNSVSDIYRFTNIVFFQTPSVTALKGLTVKTLMPVVIKKLFSSKENINNFKREVQALKTLSHPNINPLIDFFKTKHHHYIIYPFFEGRPILDYFISNPQEKTMGKIKSIIFTLVKVISFMHERGYCHRTLSVDKLIYDGKTLVITGLANSSVYINEKSKKKDHINFTRTTLPLAQQSPEMIKGEYGYKTDIWSIGFIFYVLLTGISPFQNASKSMEFAITKSEHDEESLNKLKISNSIKEFIAVCLMKQPKERPDAKLLLVHKLFKRLTVTENKQGEQLSVDFRQYHTKNQFLLLIKQIYAGSLMDMKEKEKLAQIFNEIDIDKNGVLTLEEFKKVAENSNHSLTEEETEKLFHKWDTNKNGVIEFDEFIVGMINHYQNLKKDQILQIYNLINYKQKNFIELEDILEFTGENTQYTKSVKKYFYKYSHDKKNLKKASFIQMITEIMTKEQEAIEDN